MYCPICGNNKNNSEYIVKEMQQGLKEEFEYIECSNCGCLFIKHIPENIGKYYDSDYIPHNYKENIKNKITDKIYAMYIADNKLIKFIYNGDVAPITKVWVDIVSKGIINKKSPILDIGCGNGKLLSVFKKGGFKDLTGVDLFIDDEHILNGIKIFQSSLEDFKPGRKYDMIISDHSFEHMDNQLENIKCFENLLSENGIIVLRMPVKTNPVWKKYGVNWYQIDAPRHFFLHTVESFKILLSKTNLVIEDIIFDSFDHCFLCCEKYARNISWKDEEWETFKLDDKTTNELIKEIRLLNENNNADQAIFLLKLKK